MSANPNDISIVFAANLVHHRQKLGISQERLAHLAGLHRTHIGLLESALRVPRIDTVIKLAASLLIEPNDLLAGIDWRPCSEVTGGEFHCEDPRRLHSKHRRRAA